MTARALADTALVYDSTADLPGGIEATLFEIVPLTVHFGTESLRDGVDIGGDELYRRLEATTVHPTTSQPTPGAFAEVYERLLGRSRHIVSLHVSGKLSGTVESARQAAASFPGRVTVHDTAAVSASLASAVLGVRELLQRGTTDDEIATFVDLHRRVARCFVALQTLTYLQRGGRIGRAQALAGQLLSVHPILELRDGELHPGTKVRGAARVPAELVRCAVEATAGRHDRRLIVIHSASAERADALVVALGASLAALEVDRILGLGAVVGVHAGPGALGVAIAPRPVRSGGL